MVGWWQLLGPVLPPRCERRFGTGGAYAAGSGIGIEGTKLRIHWMKTCPMQVRESITFAR